MSPEKNVFETDFRYESRRAKAVYVWLKYGSLLTGRIPDVGADECYLRDHLPNDTEYLGIGMGGNPDLTLDLEKAPVPFADDSFDCALCLDVLEHLDNIHEVFDELCRVSRQHVIISLPNPWASFINALIFAQEGQDQPLKYYGLPNERPSDRHKWFFSGDEAHDFITVRAGRNGMDVVQVDTYRARSPAQAQLKQFPFRLIAVVLPGIRWTTYENLVAGTIWSVLRKRPKDR